MNQASQPPASDSHGDDLRLSEAHSAEADLARDVLGAEARAIAGVPVEASFHRAVDLICRATTHDAGGTLVVTGLGKSGLIAQKLSATFSSTGTPSHPLHPVDAMHGDLGRIRRNDVVLALSFGGSTEEVVSLAAVLKQDGVPVIAMTGRPASDLARLAAVTLNLGDITEACPHNLAPTASTTAMLALGDALALCVSRRKNFNVDDFRKYHPGGSLGRQLMPVVEAMRFRVPDNLPLIAKNEVVSEAYANAERYAKKSGLRRAGVLLVVDEDDRLAGIVTDGDLRSALIRSGPEVWSSPIGGIMTANPTVLDDAALVRDAVHIVLEHRFDEIPIVDASRKPVGLIDVQDLAALRVVEI